MLKWRPACKAVLSEAVLTGGEALGEKYGGAAVCKTVPRPQWTSLNFLNDNRDNGNNIFIAQGCARVVSVVPVGLCCHLKTDTTLSTKKTGWQTFTTP